MYTGLFEHVTLVKFVAKSYLTFVQSFNAPSPLKICSKPGQVAVYWDLYLFYMSQLNNGLREMSSTSFPKRILYRSRMPSFWKHAWSKVVQWTETMLSKLATLPCIHWVADLKVGGTRDERSPGVQNYFIFMLFSGKKLQNNRLSHPFWELVQSPQENPGSATELDHLVTGRNEVGPR